ncbi:MAG: glycosyltransferase family 39 protein [Holosporaceae bacterium]|nr:glycosyltransferase family 39 protein [Holosporaceae bacterium]
MIENLYWGKELQPGYGKHPPLFAWISYLFYRLCFSWPESLYILTQLNLLLAFFFIFKISKLIFIEDSDGHKSYASVLIFMASVCSVFGTEKFNANTILMSLVPAVDYFFIRLLKFGKNEDAILLGVVSALSFLGKYFALLHLGCIFLFLILNREGRRLLLRPQIYIAGVVFLFGIFWHIIWMEQTNFSSLRYAMDKSINWTRSRLSTLNFMAMQTIFFASSFWACAHASQEKIRLWPDRRYSAEKYFVLFATVIPNILLLLISLGTGMRLGSFWGVNMLMMVGIYLQIINESMNLRRLFDFVRKISCFFAIVLILKLGVARQLLQNRDPTYAINIREIARQIDSDWSTKFGGHEQMKILKTDKTTSALHIYLKNSPSSYDVEHCDLYNFQDSRPHGQNVVLASLCHRNNKKMQDIQEVYGRDILFENTIPMRGDFFVYYAFVNVKDAGVESKD